MRLRDYLVRPGLMSLASDSIDTTDSDWVVQDKKLQPGDRSL